MARVELGVGDTSQEYANDMLGLSIGSLLNGKIDEDWCTDTYAYVFYPPYPEPGEEPGSYFALGGFGFTYSGDRLVGGTVTEAGEAEDGELVYHITGLNLSARQVYDWMVAGNSAALLNAVLAGDDVIEGNINKDRLIGLAGRDEIHGRGGDDWLEGGAGDDRLFGGLNNDKLFGGADNDTFAAAVTVGEFDSGNDIYDGGAGLDTVEYRLAAAPVTVDLHGGTATDGSGGTDTLISVDNAIGSGNADRILGSSRAGEMDNHLQGLGGNDVLGGEAGRDTLEGGAGTDTADYYLASAGVDVDLQVFGFQDTLGAGTDSLISIENLRGSHFADSLVGNQGVNTLSGGIGGDTLVGMGGADRLEGEDGADFLIGVNPDGSASGQDVLVGGAGADFYIVDQGDRIVEFAADDDAVVFQTSHPVGRTMVHVNEDGSREIRAYDETFTTFSSARIDSIAANTRFGAEFYNGETGSGVILSRAAPPATVFDEISYNGAAAFAEADRQFTGMMDFGINLYAGLVAPDGGAQAAPSNLDDPEAILEPITLGLAIGFLAIAIDRKVVQHFGSWGALDQELGASARVKGLAEATKSIILLGYSPGERLEVAIEHPGKDWWNPWAEGVKGDAPENTLSLIGQVTPGSDTQVGFDILALAMANDRLEFQRLIIEAAEEDAAALQAVREGREQLRSNPAGDETLINGGGRDIDAGTGNDGVVWASIGVRGAPPEGLAAPGEGPQGAGDGDQILNGGAGEDTLIYLADTVGVNVQLDVNGANGRATGAAIGTDTIVNFENVWGGSGDDILTGNNLGNVLRGGGGRDALKGGAGADTLDGGAGDDVLEGGSGADRLIGGAGVDTVSYASAGRSGSFNEGVVVDLSGHGRERGDAVGDSFVSIENITGSAYDDQLHGNERDNLFVGGGGNDFIQGGGGVDTVSYAGANVGWSVRLGSPGGVYGNGQAINDSAQPERDSYLNISNVIGSRFADVLIGGAGDNYFEGLGAIDTANGGDYIDGGDGFDIVQFNRSITADLSLLANGGSATWGGYTYSNGGFPVTWTTVPGTTVRNIEGIIGGSGTDTLRGSVGGDLLHGAAGNDTISGGAGADRLDGGVGIDLLLYDTSNVGVRINLATNVALGGHAQGDTISGFENVTGSAHADELTGSSGANTLSGGGGADRMEGGAGNDVLNGGAGTDVAIYAGARADYDIVRTGGLVTITGPDGRDTLSEIEVLRFSDGEVLVDSLVSTVTGTVRDDLLAGSGGPDLIIGLNGADRLDGGLGDDVLRGGAGTDLLIGDHGLDAADYTAAASGVTASLTAGGASNDGDGATDSYSGIENLLGSAFNDTLTGSGGSNLIAGGAGNDTLDGANGDDVLIAGAGVDVLVGGGGNDTVDYSTAAAGMRAQLNTNVSSNDGDGGTDSFSGIENLTGSAFNDILIGDGAVNVLRGGLGSDTLIGLGGHDVLWGGSGASNTLNGGLGDDRYVLEANDSVVEAAGEGNDTVEARINTYVLAANVENLIFTGVGDFNATGHAGASTITGGAGDDNLRGRGGVDVLNGGAGIDTVDYSLAASGVTARLDQQRATNDGDGATDTFSGVENLTGSIYNDVLLGNGGNNILMGGVGVDTLAGYNGDDVLHGGPAGGNNQLIGGLGNDWYVLDALDTCVELVGEGVDTVEARIGAYVMRANIENLVYTGSTKFVGTGNALDNHMTGGAQNDVLRGMGGNDTILGGLGHDELQVRGAKAQYTVTAEGSGWRVVDTVGGRDGSIYIESIETIRFLTGNTTTALTYAAPAAAGEAVTADKNDVALVLPGLLDDKGSGDAFVLPAQPDDQPLVLPGLEVDKFADAPLVLPGTEEAGPHYLGLLAHLPPTGDWMIALDPDGGLFIPPPHWSEAWG